MRRFFQGEVETVERDGPSSDVPVNAQRERSRVLIAKEDDEGEVLSGVIDDSGLDAVGLAHEQQELLTELLKTAELDEDAAPAADENADDGAGEEGTLDPDLDELYMPFDMGAAAAAAAVVRGQPPAAAAPTAAISNGMDIGTDGFESTTAHVDPSPTCLHSSPTPFDVRSNPSAPHHSPTQLEDHHGDDDSGALDGDEEGKLREPEVAPPPPSYRFRVTLTADKASFHLKTHTNMPNYAEEQPNKPPIPTMDASTHTPPFATGSPSTSTSIEEIDSSPTLAIAKPHADGADYAPPTSPSLSTESSPLPPSDIDLSELPPPCSVPPPAAMVEHIPYTLLPPHAAMDMVTMREVVRKYSELHWLHKALVLSHPGAIVPPFPARSVLEGLTPSDPATRRAQAESLQDWMEHVVAHPLLNRSPLLLGTLTVPSSKLSSIHARHSKLLETHKSVRAAVARRLSGVTRNKSMVATSADDDDNVSTAAEAFKAQTKVRRDAWADLATRVDKVVAMGAVLEAVEKKHAVGLKDIASKWGGLTIPDTLKHVAVMQPVVQKAREQGDTVLANLVNNASMQLSSLGQRFQGILQWHVAAKEALRQLEVAAERFDGAQRTLEHALAAERSAPINMDEVKRRGMMERIKAASAMVLKEKKSLDCISSLVEFDLVRTGKCLAQHMRAAIVRCAKMRAAEAMDAKYEWQSVLNQVLSLSQLDGQLTRTESWTRNIESSDGWPQPNLVDSPKPATINTLVDRLAYNNVATADTTKTKTAKSQGEGIGREGSIVSDHSCVDAPTTGALAFVDAKGIPPSPQVANEPEAATAPKVRKKTKNKGERKGSRRVVHDMPTTE